MNKEELIQFLKDNLEIEIKVQEEYDSYSDGTDSSKNLTIEAIVKLNGEEICSATDSFYT